MDTLELKEDYFTPEVTPQLVSAVREVMKGVQYDTLVGRGMSGSLVVPELARKLRKHWVIVRKPGEKQHGYKQAIGTLGKRWVFADDFVATGDTRGAVRAAIREVTTRTPGFDTQYVGTLQYHNGHGTAHPKWEPAR